MQTLHKRTLLPQPNDQLRKMVPSVSNQPSTAILSLVTDALVAASTLEQLHDIATRSEAMNMDRLFGGKYNAAKALLEGFASAIQAFDDTHCLLHISVHEIVVALKHACFSRDFNSHAYNSFLEKLYAEGETGAEVAQAFELLKAPGA